MGRKKIPRDKMPYNTNDERHGWWEMYLGSNLVWGGYFVNGKKQGYFISPSHFRTRHFIHYNITT